MFTTAKATVAKEFETHGNIEIDQIPPSSLPEKYTLAHLQHNLCTDDIPQDDKAVLRNIFILRACVRLPERISREIYDESVIDEMSTWLSEAILPSKKLIPVTGKKIPSSALKTVRVKGLAGLPPLLTLSELLLADHNSTTEVLYPKVLLTLIAYSSQDPWTTVSTRSLATEAMSRYIHQTHSSDFIVDYLLRQVVRPAFSKAKSPSTITPSGRKAIPSSAPLRRYDASESDPENMPWIYEVPYTITVFEWAVQNSTPEIAAPAFNLYLPPLLTLLDSSSTPIRLRGLSIFEVFLPLLSPAFLVQSGLAEVFEDAVTPTLSFLPNITPVDESVPLLKGTYMCLIVLGTNLYPRDEKAPPGQALKLSTQEEKYWDRLIRNGVLMGYAHSGENAEIAEVLITNMGLAIEKMGLYCVKHLKEILPILTTILSDSFASSRPSLLCTVISTLRTLITCAWPRLREPVHRAPILASLAMCWKHVQTTSTPEDPMDGVVAELKTTARCFVTAVNGEEEVEPDLRKLYEVDVELRKLFGGVPTG